MKSVRPAFHPALHRRFDLSAPPAQLRNRQANKFALVNPNVARYMDSVNGSDSTGDGTISKPYMTLAKCRDSITDQSEFKVYTVFVLNSGVITEAPILNWATFINISGPGWLFTAINTPITVAVADGEQGWLEIEGISLGGDSSSDYAFTYDGTNANLATLKLFDTFVAGAYERGRGINMAAYFEIDDVIDPADSHRWIATLFEPEAPGWWQQPGKRRPNIDAW